MAGYNCCQEKQFLDDPHYQLELVVALKLLLKMLIGTTTFNHLSCHSLADKHVL